MTLPMTRRDIADSPDLTVETVSRVVFHLDGACVLELCGKFNREIMALDRLLLASFDLPA
jgi:Bacterial regulatory proteins, crp family